MKESSLNNRQSNSTLPFLFKLGVILAGALLSSWLGSILVQQLMPVFRNYVAAIDSNAFWYLSRASGIISYIFLWASSLLGLLMTNRMISRGQNFQLVHELHQFASNFGLFLITLHFFVLLFDQYMRVSVWQILIPFTFFDYRPLSVGLGQIGLYIWLLLIGSFYVRKFIGRQNWRWIHYFSFGLFWLSLLHGFTAGTDSSLAAMQIIYWVSGSSVTFMTVYRILNAIFKRPVNN